MKYRPVVFSLICLFALASCTLPAPASPTSPRPSIPTQPVVVPTATASLPPVVTEVPTVTQTVLRPTQVPPPATAVPTQAPTTAPTQAPTIAPTLAPTAGFPQVPEAIRITAPGLNSSIVSQVKITGQADPTFEQHLMAKVSGENGQAITTKSSTIQTDVGQRGPFSLEIAFTVARNQPGRVAVWSTSAKDGGLVHFSSVEVTLKTGGTAEIKAGQSANETLVITNPTVNATSGGGKLLVQGWSGPVFENNLVVVLCGEGGSGKADPFCGTAGNVLARTSTTMQAPDAGQPGPFSVELTYKISQPVSGRVAVYYTSARDGYLLHLSSAPVRLEP